MIKQLLNLFVLLGVIALTFGQQRFAKKGENYHAKVAIHRERPYPLPLTNRINHSRFGYNHYQEGPWRQGDRITKDEVAQNFAQALLSRRKPAAEIEKERRKDNQEKLRQYTLYQAKLAKEASERPRHSPQRAGIMKKRKR